MNGGWSWLLSPRVSRFKESGVGVSCQSWDWVGVPAFYPVGSPERGKDCRRVGKAVVGSISSASSDDREAVVPAVATSQGWPAGGEIRLAVMAGESIYVNS